MDAFFAAALPPLFVAWLVAVGFAYLVRGPRLASVVLTWPLRTTLRLLRRGVGSLFVALGQWIRG